VEGKHRGVIYSLAPSPKDVNLIWAGTDDGLVQITHDGGKHWQDVSPPELTPWSKISQIDAGHFDGQTAYISVNRFRLDDLHAYIYRTRTTAGGPGRRLPRDSDDAAVNAVREDPKRPGLLLPARNVPCGCRSMDGATGTRCSSPALHFHARFVIHGDDIVLGTHGRSFWIWMTSLHCARFTKATLPKTKLFQPQVATRIQRSTNPDTPLPPETPMGQNPPDGAILDYVLKDPAKLVTLGDS